MGYTNNELIPAAVLLDGWGLTREEFMAKLNDVRFHEEKPRKRHWEEGYEDELNYLLNLPVDLRGYEHVHRFFERGDTELYDLATFLLLGERQEFVEKMGSFEKVDDLMKEGRIEEYGYSPNYGGFNLNVNKFNPTIGEGSIFEVEIYSKPSYLTGNRQFGRFRGCSDHEEGDIVFRNPTGAKFYPFKIIRFAKDYGDEQLLQIEQVVIPTPKKESYDSLEELIKNHSYFHPDFMYDFSQENGKLLYPSLGEDFTWLQKSGKYFLDWETFKNIPPTSIMMEKDGKPDPLTHSYTNLILTAEAIRHRAWKFLSEGGMYYMDEFLTAFPDAKERYDCAVRDAFNLLPKLKEEKISVDDFARQSESLFFDR